jgi:sec-independent protein translocase protein TatA
MPLGLHPWYLIILLAIVLIIFGPGKLPELGGAIGRGIREFQRTTSQITDEVKTAVNTPPASNSTSSASTATEPGKPEPEK